MQQLALRSSACRVIKGLFTVSVNRNLGKQDEFTLFCQHVVSPTTRPRTSEFAKLFILSSKSQHVSGKLT